MTVFILNTQWISRRIYQLSLFTRVNYFIIKYGEALQPTGIRFERRNIHYEENNQNYCVVPGRANDDQRLCKLFGKRRDQKHTAS